VAEKIRKRGGRPAKATPAPATRNVAKNVRFRLDVYDSVKHTYRPFYGKSAIVPLATTRLHHALWRGFLIWLESGEWKKHIKPEEQAAVDD
jgi:hypothetical protein